MKNVTFRQLKVFEAVARHLSFSRAAEELHLTQPAVSMQVKSLEEGVGLPLTEQIGKRIFLTAAGTELARHARLLSQQLRDTEAALDAMKGLRGGLLNIGVVSTAKYFAPRLLAEFRKLHPEVELRLGIHNRELIVQQLADNQIDLAIMGSPPDEMETVAQPFAEHPLIVIAATDHGLAKKRRIPPTALAGETFLLREPGSGTRGAMERFFADNGVALATTMEISSNETIKQAVMAGLGVSFISAHTVGLELATRRLARLDVLGTPVKRTWHVVRRVEKRLLPVAEAFDTFMAERGQALIAAQLSTDNAQFRPPAGRSRGKRT